MRIKGVFLLFLILNSCGWKRKPSATRLRIRLATEVSSIDQMQSADSVSRNIIESLNEPLIRLNQNNILVPDLAESWKVDQAFKRYTFKLRPNLKWSDGKDLVAGQFVDAVEHALTVSNAVPTSSFLLPLENAPDFFSGKLKDFKKVGVKALDDHTLQFTLSVSLPHWIYVTTNPVLLPIRKELLEKFGSRWTDVSHYVGTGAYRLREKTLWGKIVCSKNPYYWNQEEIKNSFPEIEYRVIAEGNTAFTLYKTGEFDIIDGVPSMLTPILEKTEAGFKSQKTLFITGLGFQLDNPITHDQDLRRALAMAIDFKSMKHLLNNDSDINVWWIPPELTKSDKASALAYNPVEARKLWEHLRVHPKKIEYLYPSSPRSTLLAQFLQQQWKKNIGADIELSPQEWKVYLKSRVSGDFPLFQQNWLADYPAAINFLEIFSCHNEQNNPHFCNKDFDELLEKSNIAKSEDERMKLLLKAEEILLKKEVAVIPLTRENLNFLVQPRLNGFATNNASEYRISDIHL